MSTADALAGAGAKPAGKRPWFLEQDLERALAMTMAIAQELAVARQRIDTLERLLIEKALLGDAEIEAYVPDATVAVERARWTQEYLARIFRGVQQENEAAAFSDKHELASEDVADEVGV